MRTLPRSLLALAVVATGVLTGCPDDPTQSDDLAWTKSVGAETLQVTAESETDWVYLSFKTKGVIATPAKPEESLDWDLALRRYNMKTNGGTSGKGQGASADLGELDQKTTDVAKVGAWTADDVIEDARTGDEVSMNSVLSGWYSYHFVKHELVSDYHLYAVRAADGQVATLKVFTYYDDAGTAGHYQLVVRFPVSTGDGPMDNPDTKPKSCVAANGSLAPDTITDADGVVRGETNFDARAGKVYFSFENRGAVTIDGDAKTSTAWDLGLDDWLFTTNSGTSGGAQGGLLKSDTKDFAAATTAPETGWVVDDVEQIALERKESTNGQIAGWFEYEPGTQCIRPFGDVYWIRTAAGKFAKLQIESYYHPVDGAKKFYRLRWAYRPDGGRAF